MSNHAVLAPSSSRCYRQEDTFGCKVILSTCVYSGLLISVKSTNIVFCGEEYWHCLSCDRQLAFYWCPQLFFFLFFLYFLPGVCDKDLTLFIVWQTTISCLVWVLFEWQVHRCLYLWWTLTILDAFCEVHRYWCLWWRPTSERAFNHPQLDRRVAVQKMREEN